MPAACCPASFPIPRAICRARCVSGGCSVPQGAGPVWDWPRHGPRWGFLCQLSLSPRCPVSPTDLNRISRFKGQRSNVVWAAGVTRRDNGPLANFLAVVKAIRPVGRRASHAARSCSGTAAPVPAPRCRPWYAAI